MSIGNIDRFDIQDISIRDLVLDDLSGYVDLLKQIDESILDRQASIVIYEVYRNSAPATDAEIPLTVKRWIAAHTVLRLIPALRTFIAKYEIRSETYERGASIRYDQLEMLDDVQVMVEQRIHELRNQVEIDLAGEFSAGPPLYDRPGITTEKVKFATHDPWRIGSRMFDRDDEFPWR